MQEVYVDLYFLINAGMDLLCLAATASLLHRKIRRWRLFLAAGIGGIYAVLSLLYGGNGWLSLLGDLGAALLLAVTVFWQRGLSFPRLLQCAGVEFLVSLLMGGVMTGLYRLLNYLDLPFSEEGDGISVWLFALLGAVAGLVTVKGGKLFGVSQKIRAVTVRARLFGKDVELLAMVDNGNLLRDPVSGRAVIVADRKKLLPHLPEDLRRVWRGGVDAFPTDAVYARSVRLIPAQSATGHSLLPALLPEKLELYDGRSVIPSDYLIALSDLGGTAAGFDAVLPAG